MKNRTTVLATIAGVGAAGAIGLALMAGPVQAEDPAPSSSASSGSATPDRGADRAADRAARQDELAAALATELGIDKAKVAAALEKVQTVREAEAKTDRVADLKARLDAAVKAGTLTEEQSAAILKAAEAGVLPQGGHGGGGRRGR
jgi:hypothetical protein